MPIHRRRNQAIRHFNSATGTTINTADRAIVGLSRYMTTYHSGTNYCHPKELGILASIANGCMKLLVRIFAALIGGILMFVLVAYVLPAML